MSTLTPARRELLWAVSAGVVASYFPTRGESYVLHQETRRRVDAQIRWLRQAGLVEVPPRPMGSFRPVTVQITDKGREALR